MSGVVNAKASNIGLCGVELGKYALAKCNESAKQSSICPSRNRRRRRRREEEEEEQVQEVLSGRFNQISFAC